MLYVDEPRTQNRKKSSKHIQQFDDMSDDEILSDEEFKAQIKKKLSEYCEYFNDIFWFLSMDSSTYNILSSDISLECRVGFDNFFMF
jgi:hypothetical protein